MLAGYVAGSFSVKARVGYDALVGQNVEESLRNLGRITLEGMFRVDPTMLTILQDKTAASGKA